MINNNNSLFMSVFSKYTMEPEIHKNKKNKIGAKI